MTAEELIDKFLEAADDKDVGVTHPLLAKKQNKKSGRRYLKANYGSAGLPVNWNDDWN